MSSPNLKTGICRTPLYTPWPSEFPQKRYLRRFDTLRVYTKSFTRKTEAVNPVDKMCGPLAHFKSAFLSVYSKCHLGFENWVMWGNMCVTITTPFVTIILTDVAEYLSSFHDGMSFASETVYRSPAWLSLKTMVTLPSWLLKFWQWGFHKQSSLWQSKEILLWVFSYMLHKNIFFSLPLLYAPVPVTAGIECILKDNNE